MLCFVQTGTLTPGLIETRHVATSMPAKCNLFRTIGKERTKNKLAGYVTAHLRSRIGVLAEQVCRFGLVVFDGGFKWS